MPLCCHRWAQPTKDHISIAARLADKYLEQAAAQLTQLCSSNSSDTTAATAESSAAAAAGLDPLVFKTRVRGLLGTMAATVIGLMSRLRDFDGFVSDPDSSSSWPQLQVVGGVVGGQQVGSPGVRDRAAVALAGAMKRLRGGGDRELLEQVCVWGGERVCTSMVDTG
jgi:hypothetical protein